MSLIAIDLDETVYSFQDAIRDVFFDLCEERNDKSILRLAYSNNFEWRNLVDHDKKIAYEAIERVHEGALKQTPFKDSVEVCNLLAQKHEIIYVGSRFDKHAGNTMAWLDINGFPRGELICADPKKPKNNFLQEVQYLIDDRPKTILDFLYDQRWNGEPRKVFSLWRPYNANLTDIKNVYLAPTWRGLRYYLERKSVL